MNIEEVSIYKNNIIAKKSKVLWVNLLNYFFCLIITFISCIFIGNPIIASLPMYQASQENISAISNELYTMVDEFRIQTYNQTTKSLTSVSEMGEAYLRNLCKTSLYLNSLPYGTKEIQKEETMFETAQGSYPNDNLRYYYEVKKTQYEELQPLLYEGKDYSLIYIDNIDGFYHELVMKLNDPSCSSYFISEEEYEKLDSMYKVVSRYCILTSQTATNLMNYLLYGTSGGIEEKVHNALYSSYYKASEHATNEIESRYPPYISSYNKIVNEGQTLTAIYVVGYLLCYLFAFAICYIVIPLFDKEKTFSKTVGFRTLKCGYSTVNEMTPSWPRFLVNYVSRLIIGLSSLIFCFFFMGSLDLTSLIIGGFSFFALLAFSLIYGILSSIFIFIRKEHQDFSSFLGGMLIKDIQIYEGPLEERENDENNGK